MPISACLTLTDGLQEAVALVEQQKTEQQLLRMELAKGERAGKVLLSLLNPCGCRLTCPLLCCSL
jgi:hypothetical protein